MEQKKNGFLGRGARIALIAFVAVILLFIALNQFYINILWFNEVDYMQIFLKGITTKAIMGIPLFLILFVVLSVYFKMLTKAGGEPRTKIVEKGGFLKGKLPYLLSLVVSALISIQATSSLWYKWLEFKNSTAFNVTDPIFGRDVSFYVFELPFFQGLLNVAYVVLAVLFISTAVYSFLIIADKNMLEKKFGGGQFEMDLPVKGLFGRLWDAFRIQFSIFGAVFFLLLGVSFFLKRYDVLYSETGIVYGAGYTDVSITVPFYLIVIALCGVAALATLFFGIRKKFKPLLITIAAIIVVNLAGVLVAGIVEGYVVSPNEFSKEEPYIANNILYTQKAYGLDDIQVKDFAVQQNISAEDIKKNETTINNIPINDYKPTLGTYNSLQGIRPYYEFNDIDVDRYELNGKYTQVFISTRELNTTKLADSAQTWINQHLKYTHGFGVAVSPVNQVNSTGQPVMIAKDIPTNSDYPEIQLTQPRIYFGEKTDSYAVVDTTAKEFDYPSGSDNAENVYDGTAGIPLNFINKISFSLSNGTLKFLLNSDVNSNSKIIIHRNVVERVQKIAPFFSYDEDPYAVIIDGRLYWIMDAMTTTDRYPYSQPYASGEVSYNYIRNSVKVVIDAYNGDVTFYNIDETDPIAAVYGKIYPELFKSFDEMPQDFKEHLRYSETLFNIQAEMYRNYHMTNSGVFYNKEDVWQIANQFYQDSKEPVRVNSSYLIMKLPERQEEFMLMVPFTPQNKDNMVAWMAGICDGDDYGKLVVYQFPKQSLVYGPMQIEKRIDQDTIISPQLTLLGQQGSSVLRGNMQAIPIEDGILYVEAVYVQASGSEGSQSLPEAKKIIACYKERIVMADSLGDALGQIFDLSDEEKGEIGGGGTQTPPIGTDATISELIKKADELYNSAQQASQSGDWAAYGEYMKQLGQVLEQLKALQQ